MIDLCCKYEESDSKSLSQRISEQQKNNGVYISE